MVVIQVTIIIVIVIIIVIINLFFDQSYSFLSLSEFSDENMMDPYNLAICFGPTLVPIPEDKDQVCVCVCVCLCVCIYLVVIYRKITMLVLSHLQIYYYPVCFNFENMNILALITSASSFCASICVCVCACVSWY